jgi:hypothetical protein
MIELACRSKECAPPPVGEGGSSPQGKGWVPDDVKVKVNRVGNIDTDRLERRAARLRSEIDDPDFVYPGARMGFRHRAAELTKIESELVKRGSLAVADRRTSVVAALSPLVVELAGCQSAECAPPPVGVGGSMPEGVVGWEQRPAPWGKERVVGGYVEHDPIIDRESSVGKYLARQIERRMGYMNMAEHQEVWSTSLPYRTFTGSMEGREWLSEQLHEGATGEGALALMNLVHDTFRKGLPDGVSVVPVSRMVDNEVAGDPFAPNFYWHQGTKNEERGGSGFTSWYLGRGERGSSDLAPHQSGIRAGEDNDYRTKWEGDVSVDDVFGQFGDTQMEVIVGRPGALARVLQGKSVHAVSAAIELACRDASCAPPPVGVGGSRAQGLQRSLAHPSIVDLVEETSEESRATQRQYLETRGEMIGFHQLDKSNGLRMDREVEYDMLSEVVPVEEGFVRMGSDEAEALVRRVREVFPSASVGWFRDVDPRAVEAVLDGAALYPEEVRAYVEGVAIGYTENENHVAAFGPHGGGLNGPSAPGATLWLGPKAVRPAVGEARPEGRAASVMATVDGFNRHRIVGAHEMAHAVHNMAAQRAWEQDARRIDLRTDALVPEAPTTPYGGLDVGERVAETFALAARDSFKGLLPSQQGLIVSVLDRAGLRPEQLDFAAEEREPYEVQFFGDDFGLDEAAAELQASGCQSEDCAPPPVGTGGSKPGSARVAELDSERIQAVEAEIIEAYGEIWDDIPDVIDRTYRIQTALNARTWEGAKVEDAYQAAVMVVDGDGEEVEHYVGLRRDGWHDGLRSVFSATMKSPEPDADVQVLLVRMHEATQQVFQDHLVGQVELARSFDPVTDAGDAMTGNERSSSLYGSRKDVDTAPSSGVTSWAAYTNEAGDWGTEYVEQRFPIEQVLMREGSIDGEFLVGESVERVREIVGR